MSAVTSPVQLAPEETAELADALTKYYTSQYRDDVCLPNWKDHLAKRRDEDANFRNILDRTEKWVIGRRVAANERVLVVGGGTGADFMAFAKRG